MIGFGLREKLWTQRVIKKKVNRHLKAREGKKDYLFRFEKTEMGL